MNLLGAMYAAVLFLGATNASAVQSVVAIERTVFYRERAAGMYSELPYAFSQVIHTRKNWSELYQSKPSESSKNWLLINHYEDLLNLLLLQVAIETIYVAIQTFIYTMILYSMIGFEWKIAKFLWFYYYILMCFIYFTMYGMMVVALTPGHQIAAIVMSFFLSFWNLFSGFLIPRPVCDIVSRYIWHNASNHT